jgi:hypothetical protein
MFYDPPNRLAKFFPVEAAPQPVQSTADKLLCGAWNVKLEVVRLVDDDGSVDAAISYEVRGELTDSDSDLLAKLLAQFSRGETGGVA